MCTRPKCQKNGALRRKIGCVYDVGRIDSKMDSLGVITESVKLYQYVILL